MAGEFQSGSRPIEVGTGDARYKSETLGAKKHLLSRAIEMSGGRESDVGRA